MFYNITGSFPGGFQQYIYIVQQYSIDQGDIITS